MKRKCEELELNGKLREESESRVDIALARAALGLWEWHIRSDTFKLSQYATEILKSFPQEQRNYKLILRSLQNAMSVNFVYNTNKVNGCGYMKGGDYLIKMRFLMKA